MSDAHKLLSIEYLCVSSHKLLSIEDRVSWNSDFRFYSQLVFRFLQLPSVIEEGFEECLIPRCNLGKS